jgi:hypothetical protein
MYYLCKVKAIKLRCKKLKIMNALENLIGENTYQVIDHESNRFNFCELVDIDEQLLEDAENANEYQLSEELPEDVKRAIDTMIDNGVKIEDFTGVITFENNDTTYYLLTW